METILVRANLLEFLSAEVIRFLNEDPSNRMGEAWGDERIWEQPLLGAANGADPIFETFKDTVDPLHWTPIEAFAAGGLEAKAEELTAVSWVLPKNEQTKKDNALRKDLTTERWARSRFFGEEANIKLRVHLVEFLKNAGIEAVAPTRLPDWSRLNSERYIYTSKWSERHIAYACGLGTFGVSHGLITPLGKAVRLGSVVLRGLIPTAPRPYTSYDEYCPFKANKTCGACIKRCPSGALSERGNDKRLCSAYMDNEISPYVMEHFGFNGYGCGICQTGVPCTSGIPGK